MEVRWKKPSYISVLAGMSQEGSILLISIATRAAFTMVFFASPGWMLTP